MTIPVSFEWTLRLDRGSFLRWLRGDMFISALEERGSYHSATATPGSSWWGVCSLRPVSVPIICHLDCWWIVPEQVKLCTLSIIFDCSRAAQQKEHLLWSRDIVQGRRWTEAGRRPTTKTAQWMTVMQHSKNILPSCTLNNDYVWKEKLRAISIYRNAPVLMNRWMIRWDFGGLEQQMQSSSIIIFYLEFHT